jgi:hypothetical protein
MSSLSSIWDVSQEQEHYLKQVKKCETFIFVKKGDAFYPVGTGFFIGIGRLWTQK